MKRREENKKMGPGGGGGGGGGGERRGGREEEEEERRKRGGGEGEEEERRRKRGGEEEEEEEEERRRKRRRRRRRKREEEEEERRRKRRRKRGGEKDFFSLPQIQFLCYDISPHYTPCPAKSILVYSPKTSYASTSSKTYSHASDQSSASYNRLESPSHCKVPESKEIMIDFKPNPSAEPVVRRGKKRILQKTRSEGEILVDPSLLMDEGEGSVSDSDTSTMIRTLSSSSQEEEFHENLVYHSIFDSEDPSKQPAIAKHTKPGTPDKDLTTSKQPTAGKTAHSPSVSCDSLNTRDISESHWNESQTTVFMTQKITMLQGCHRRLSDYVGLTGELLLTNISSTYQLKPPCCMTHLGIGNTPPGLRISCSDLSASLSPAAAVAAMTPGSRRRHLLQLQHMQRSSMDTEALDTEDFDLESEKTIAASVPSKSTTLTPKKEKPSPDLPPLSKINVNKTTTVPKFSVTLPSDEPKKIRVKKHYLSRYG
ncbi:hypothetical protein WDU94_005282 [Cyamophila willieti]